MSFFQDEIAHISTSINGTKVRKDVYRHMFLGLLALLALIPMWDASQVVIYFIGVIALFGIGVHLMRRIFFPHIGLDELAVNAKASPMASAVVFASIVFFMCTLFFTASQLIGLK
jgi:hypothetical protein